MHEFLQSGELKAQAKCLLGYRFLLVFVIVINTMMVLRIPAAPPGQAVAPATGQRKTPVANASDTRRVGSSLSAVPKAAGQHGDNTETDQPAPTNFVAMLPQATVASWRAKLLQQVVTETAAQPSQDFNWQPWTHSLVADWLHVAQELVHERTSHADPADVDPPLENPQVTEPPETSSHPPQTRRDLTLVASEPQTTDGQRSPATLDAAGTGLLLRNPVENNGVIRFLVDRRIMELQPGEAHQFSPADKWMIRFHPGGDFENVQRALSPGTYEFRVTSHGWELTAVGP